MTKIYNKHITCILFYFSMLYYGFFLYRSVEDNLAQPPPQRYNIISLTTKTFFKFFFKILETLCVYGCVDHSISIPPIQFEWLGYSPLLDTHSVILWISLYVFIKKTFHPKTLFTFGVNNSL